MELYVDEDLDDLPNLPEVVTTWHGCCCTLSRLGWGWLSPAYKLTFAAHVTCIYMYLDDHDENHQPMTRDTGPDDGGKNRTSTTTTVED